MNSRQPFTPASSAQEGSSGSFTYAVDSTPVEASSPAGIITVEIHTATLERNVIGRQPISWDLRIACAANFGVAAITNTSAPEAFSPTIWESMVGSATS